MDGVRATVVTAAERVATRFGEVAAVEEQQKVTSAIARNVDHAARATDGTANVAEQPSGAALETRRYGSSRNGQTGKIATDRLNQRIDRFISEVTAEPERAE